MTASCPGAAAVRARWTARSLAGAFLDLALAWACLCFATLASAAARLLALLGLPLPCTCARPHLPCLLVFLARYPSRALDSLHGSLRSRFPFAADATPTSDDDDDEEAVDGDLRREAEEERQREAQCTELRRELDKERSAAASAAEEAMSMILRLQKEKSALEIEARQQRRAADERCAFYEDEVEELRDIVLLREREARALRKEVDAYRRLLGLASEDYDDEEEMVTPHSIFLEGQPSSSKSVGTNRGDDRIVQLGNDSVFSFKTPFLCEQLVPPVPADHVKVGNDDSIVVQTPGEVPVAKSKLEVESCEDDGTETVEIPPLSARSLGFDQGGDFHVDAAAGMEDTEEEAADEFQEVDCGSIDKTSHDHTGSENDACIYDVHVVDDICVSTEVKGLIGRSYSDATIQAEKLQTRAAADDLLGKSLNAIKGAQDKIRVVASERRRSLQLELLEDIANQLQEIKEAAETGRHMYRASPKNSKKN
ncbi:uncharacterized protein LOC133924010 [Phragmites australis]|uniref:uncharacterized protein LOC133924010 n=1 Tax=Phragmites australis TaxID=29695 RepID=UPI002D76EC57|nr:uncharacterized protein LOC133924010 [Phragmites australis]XP_062225347.1 uncharacterized protein LOC133924010 [Phragmites australis]